VLLMLGDVKADEGIALQKKYFADIPAGAPPPFAIPVNLTKEERPARRGKIGTLAAIAIGLVSCRRGAHRLVRHALLDQALPAAARTSATGS